MTKGKFEFKSWFIITPKTTCNIYISQFRIPVVVGSKPLIDFAFLMLFLQGGLS